MIPIKNEQKISNVPRLEESADTLYHRILPEIMVDSQKTLKVWDQVKKLLSAPISSCQEFLTRHDISEINHSRRTLNLKYPTRCSSRNIDKLESLLFTFYKKNLPEIIENWKEVMNLSAEMMENAEAMIDVYQKLLNQNEDEYSDIESTGNPPTIYLQDDDIFEKMDCSDRKISESEINYVELSRKSTIEKVASDGMYEAYSSSESDEASLSDSDDRTPTSSKYSYTHEEDLDMLKCIQENNGHRIAGAPQFWASMKNRGILSTHHSPISLALHWSEYIYARLDVLITDDFEKMKFNEALIKAQDDKIKKIKTRRKRRTYRCKNCIYASSRSTNIIRHHQRMHLNTIEKSCCGITFRTKYDWYIHCEVAHADDKSKSLAWRGKKKFDETLSSVEMMVEKKKCHEALLKEMGLQSLDQVNLEDVPLIYLIENPELREEIQSSINNSKNKDNSHKRNACVESDENSGITETLSYVSSSERSFSSSLQSSKENSPLLIKEIAYVEDCNEKEGQKNITQCSSDDYFDRNHFNPNELPFFDLSNTPIYLDWMEDPIII